MEGKRLHNENFNSTAETVLFLRQLQLTFQQSKRIKPKLFIVIVLIFSKRNPCQREALKFMQIIGGIMQRKPALVCPFLRLQQLPLLEINARLHGIHRAQIGSGGADVQALRFIQQLERVVQVALGFFQVRSEEHTSELQS